MKYQSVFLATALFLAAGTIFAAKPTATPAITYEDFSSMEISDSSKTLNIMMFTFNSGKWAYYLYGTSTEEDAVPYQLKLNEANAKLYGEVIAEKQGGKIISSLDLPGGLTDDLDLSKAQQIYSFSIPFNDSDVASFGLSGSNPSENHNATVTLPSDLSTIYTGATANNGMEFSEYETGNNSSALVYGKPQWHLNNGALFLVSVSAPTIIDNTPQQGQPLPAPVTTLLIALAFGGAFVMYRNRKQAKA